MSSELRAKIECLVDEFWVDAKSFAIDRILALFAEQPATAKLPEGVDLVSGPDGRYHVMANGKFLLTKAMMWCKMLMPIHEYPGEFTTCHQARAAALSATPVPGESKPKSHVIPTAGEYVVGCDAAGTPRTINHKPIAETKPDPATCKQPLQVDHLARAVTDADLLKLADLLHLGGAKFVADCVREVARAAGGSKPA